MSKSSLIFWFESVDLCLQLSPCPLLRNSIDLDEMLVDHQRIADEARVFELSLDRIANNLEKQLARFFAF